MKVAAAILYAIALVAALTIAPYAEGKWIIRKVSAAPTYLIDEDFEETGTPTVGGWTATGSPEYDNASHSTLTGEALELDSGDQTYASYTANSTVWAATKIELASSAIPSSAVSYFAIRSSSGGALVILRIGVGGSGKVALFCAGVDGTASSTFTISGATLYYVWLKYVDGGTCELYVSTTPTKPAMSTDSATQFSTSATDDNSGDAARVDFRGGAYLNGVYYDEVFVSTSELTNPWGD